MPSLSSSPRMRSAPQRGLRAAISRIRAARDVGGRPGGRERRRQKARNPARCQRRIVAGWTSKVASRQARATRAARAIVTRCQGCPSDATCDLPVRYDELLSKKRVLRDEFGATANEIRGESRKEPKKVDHAWRLTPSARGWHL